MEKAVRYDIDGRSFEGMLVCDDNVGTKRRGILMQPDWKGVCAETIAQAKLLAGRDYVVFMADMFGTGYGAKPKAIPDLMKAIRTVRDDLPFTLRAGAKAFEVMKAEARALIDESKVAAVGYCAGGGFALEQARAGADFDAVVVFHVTNPNPVDKTARCEVKGHVLIVHGAIDPVTPKPAIHALEEELSAAEAPWQTILFSGAGHSFTDPTAQTAPNLYDADLARRTYAFTREFLSNVP
jgi:dienelactone hydrolase